MELSPREKDKLLIFTAALLAERRRARGRSELATSSVAPSIGALKQITDGDKDYGKKSVVELPAGIQWVQVDLGAEADGRRSQVRHKFVIQIRRFRDDDLAAASRELNALDGYKKLLLGVELIEQVFGEPGLDLQVNQAVLDGGGGVHKAVLDMI